VRESERVRERGRGRGIESIYTIGRADFTMERITTSNVCDGPVVEGIIKGSYKKKLERRKKEKKLRPNENKKVTI